MVLLLVLLPTILAVSLATTECRASSPVSRMDLHLHSQKNASGHWTIMVNAQRSIRSENEREVIIDVHRQTRLSHNNEMEQVVSMTTVYPPLNDTSMPEAIEPSTTRLANITTPTTSATPSTTTVTPSTTTATPSTPSATTANTSTTSPKSCPHPGYELYPEFNCYKAFNSISEWRTWSEARDQCVRDGGDLMVMETERERLDVYLPLCKNESFYYSPWVGVHKPEGEDGWMTVNGEPALSTWWSPGEPDEDPAFKCAFAYSDGLLGSDNCVAEQSFICEISL